MNKFHRAHPQFSQCGLNCRLCTMHLGGYCPGCGGEGHRGCAITRCALEQGAGEFCTGCTQFPCARYDKMAEYDSFIPHSLMVQDLERAQELGLEGYLAQLEERREILDQLLAGWNDGRRKTFFGLAVYLLEPERLRRAFAEIQGASTAETSVKEKALTAAAILKTAAQAQGAVLKLNKKPKEK